jgi:L-lactate dehydrogenase complex protein LldE
MRIALFVTCLVDLFRPVVGHATVKLLEQSGATVVIPRGQTCCGQPAYNNGDRDSARLLARRVIDEFEGVDYVVVPSGSCGGMIKCHYPDLLAGDEQYAEKARQLAARCYELTRFLVEVADIQITNVVFNEQVTYHDSCSCLRELNIKSEPRQLLHAVKSLQLNEMEATEECCGFGGTFCVKYEELSINMVNNKVNHIEQSGANVVLAADMGCLMNIAGRIKRRGIDVRVYHIAEVLADMVQDNGIGGDSAQ